MGMFDYLRCDVELPNIGLRPDIEFQTKFFCRCFARFTITSKGRLVDVRKKDASLKESPQREEIDFN